MTSKIYGPFQYLILEDLNDEVKDEETIKFYLSKTCEKILDKSYNKEEFCPPLSFDFYLKGKGNIIDSDLEYNDTNECMFVYQTENAWVILFKVEVC